MAGQPVSQYRVERLYSKHWVPIALAGFVLIGATGVAVYFRLRRSASKPALPPPTHIVPLTNLPGFQDNARFSPDGNQIAFTWFGDPDYNEDIYVKQIGVEKPLRLTTDPAKDESPTWSPDGRYIAFRRHGEAKDTIYVVPALGGLERELHTSKAIHFDGQSLDWSPDGKYLAYVDKGPRDSEAIFVLSVASPKEKRPLTISAGFSHDYWPRFSPNGRTVAFVRDARDIFLVRIAGGEPKRLTFDDAIDDTFIYGLDWSPDGAYIIFFSNRVGGKLRPWKVLASGGQPEPLSMPVSVVEEPALSRNGRRLAYTQREFNSNIWRYEVSAGVRPGGPPTELIASAGVNMDPQFSPDGKRIAFVSSRSGSLEIWVCNTDGSNPRQLTSVGRIGARFPRWAPGGREIAFQTPLTNEGENIYVVGAEGGQPQRLDTGHSRVAAPSWSRDGKWIYFGSDRSGAWQVWKVPTRRGPAVQVTKKGGLGGLESPDGKTFYYAKGRFAQGLWKVPAQGGEETQVHPQVLAPLFEGWGLAREGIYFYNDNTEAVEFFGFATHQVTQILKPGKRGGDVALSPDGRWILFGQADVNTSHIMMVENFRW